MALPPTQLPPKCPMTNINAVNTRVTSFSVDSYYNSYKDLFLKASFRRFEVDDVPQKQVVFVLIHVSRSRSMREVKTSLVESLRKKLFDDLKSNLEKEGRFLVRQDLDSALTNPIWPTSTARLKALSMFPVCAISEADKQWLATKEHREAVKTYLSNYSSTIPAEPVSLLPCITMTLPPTSQLHLKDSMTNINAVDMNATSFWVNSYYKNRKDLFVEANVRRFEVEVPQKQESVFVLVHVSKSDGLRDEKTSVVDSLLQKLFDDLETNLEEKGQYLLRQGLFSALAKPTWPSSTAQLSTSSEVPVYVISTATQKWLDTKGHKEAVKTQLRAINSTLPAELVSQLSAKA